MFVKFVSTGQIKFNFDKFCSKLKGSSFAVNRASTRKQKKTMGNMGFFATKNGAYMGKIRDKSIPMQHVSNFHQIKGQSKTESLFMNEHKNFDHVVIYKHFELIFWFSLYLQRNCL